MEKTNIDRLYEIGIEHGVDKETIKSVMDNLKNLWQTIKKVIQNVWQTIKPIVEKIMILSKDKELCRLINMEKRVKSKRLKKKYRDKQMRYIVMKYSKC